MNREILFRAKREATNEWVYGYFVNEYDDFQIYIQPQIITQSGREYINENTLGQFTGLTDKNGTKIFENDILQVNCRCHGNEIGRVCIYYKYAMYLCDVIYGDIDFDTLGMLNANYQLEVIGNIYDNTELIEK